jgi:hypothetical protein
MEIIGSNLPAVVEALVDGALEQFRESPGGAAEFRHPGF